MSGASPILKNMFTYYKSIKYCENPERVPNFVGFDRKQKF